MKRDRDGGASTNKNEALVRFGSAPEATKSLNQEIFSSHVFQVHCHLSLSTGAAVRMLYGEDGRIVGLVSLATSYFVLSNALEHTNPHADYDRLTILILPNCAECVFFSFIK